MNPRLRAFTLTSLLLLLAGAAAAADKPPQTLHRVGDHWTAWEPPTSFPAGTEVYTIVPGDTLWTLAAHHLGDPYLWPQIWERNRYILDAHWIYPGDPLLMGVEVTTPEIPPEAPLGGVPPEGAAAAATAPGEGAGAGEENFGYRTANAAAGEPGPLGAESDIYCSGFIGDLDEDLPYNLIGSEYQAQSPIIDAVSGQLRESGHHGIYGSDTIKFALDTGDIVYLDGGRAAGLTPGKLLTAVLPEEKVHHPLTGALVGRFYRFLGRVRVLSVQQDTAIAEIVQSCSPLFVGSRLFPFQPEPVPLGRRGRVRPVNMPSPAEALANAPVILRSKDNLISLGEDSVVFIDRGEDSDVVPGDLFTIYRMNRGNLPPVVLGELAVLSVHAHSAVARILRSRFSIYVGDRLELK